MPPTIRRAIATKTATAIQSACGLAMTTVPATTVPVTIAPVTTAPVTTAPATTAPATTATGLLMGGTTATGIETSTRGTPEITVTATVVLKAAEAAEVVAAIVIMAGIVTMADVEVEAEVVANVVGSKARRRSRPTLSSTRVTLRSRRRASASFVLPRPILHRSRATSS